jgi:hypothetical protein
MTAGPFHVEIGRLVDTRLAGKAAGFPDGGWERKGEVRLSTTGRWVWHVATDGSGVVTLKDAATLETCGTHHLASDLFLKALASQECTIATFREAPDTLTIYANLGDSFAFLSTLLASEVGIHDPAAPKLFESIAECLDERLWSARFVAADRFLVVDDIGNLSLFAWPSARKLADCALLDALRNEEDSFGIWPGADECDDLSLGEYTFVVDDLLLVSVCDKDEPDQLLALAGLDAQTLEPRGVVRVPATCAAQLRQIGADEFDVDDVTDRRRLKFVRM